MQAVAAERKEAMGSVLSMVSWDIPDHVGNTALMDAVKGDHSECIGYLLAQGANASASDAEGCSALHLCRCASPTRVAPTISNSIPLDPPGTVARVTCTTCSTSAACADAGQRRPASARAAAPDDVDALASPGGATVSNSIPLDPPGTVALPSARAE